MDKNKGLFWKSLIGKYIIRYGLLIIVYFLGYQLNLNNNFLSGFILIIAGLTYYFYFSLTGERSFLKFNAVFSGVWLCTIGLAQMRLLEYQVSWIYLTWINVCTAHVLFLIANDLAYKYFPFLERKFNLNKINEKHINIKYEAKPERYFWIATVTAAIGIICFIANVLIKGYIPFFASSSNTNAYVNFYTRFHIFVVASMVSGGLSYYCIKKSHLSAIKRLLLVIYIFVLVFVIPILEVQRGTFITAALILTAAVYLMSNRKFWVLLSCIIVILGVYQFGSSLRGYSDTQLNAYFKPKQIVNEASETSNYKLPAKAAFLYSYLTVSQDNFNSAVEKKTINTWGIWQLKPFNVVLRSKWIDDKLAQAEYYTTLHQVAPYLTTYNLISMAYYDYGLIGVIILTFLWSFAFGLIEAFYSKYKGTFSCVAYGVCLIPVALCFFDSWMSNFTTWLMWGAVFLMFLAGSFTLKKKPQTTNR